VIPYQAMGMPVILQTDFQGCPVPARGKVRDIYDVGEHLVLVATDRLSAFDVVFPNGIPGKGRVLTQLSAWWFRQMNDLVLHHVVSSEVKDLPPAFQAYHDVLEGRTMLVKKVTPLPVECIVRGYLSGSGWAEYQRTGSVCGVTLPTGLVESVRLDEPIFTPSTKAQEGHDQNIDFEDMARRLGPNGGALAATVKEVSIAVYVRACQVAEAKGIIIADTKLEFGLDSSGQLVLIDELLTPDSSRFWPKDQYGPGRPGGQPSFDKQFVRDYLVQVGWNKQPPAPELPPEIVQRTSEKYHEVLQRLTGGV